MLDSNLRGVSHRSSHESTKAPYVPRLRWLSAMPKRGTWLLVLIVISLVLLGCQEDVSPVRTPVEQPDQLPTATVQQAVPRPTLPRPTLPPPTLSVPEKTEILGRWQRLDTTGGGGQTGIATHPTDPDIVYMASDNGGLLKTENGGDSWFSASSNLGAYRLGFVVLDPLDPDVVYVTASTQYGLWTEGGGSGEIYRSPNGGASWEFVSDAMGFQNSFPNQASIIIPHDPDRPDRFDRDGDRLSDVIIVGGWTGPVDPPVGGIWRSEDEGRTFAQLALEDRNITALHSFAGDTSVLFLTTYEGEVYRSEDLGTRWVEITGNLPLAHPIDLAVHPENKDILYVTCRRCQAGKPPVWKTKDGGQRWQAASRGLNAKKSTGFPKILIDRFDPETLYLTTFRTQMGVYKSADGGGHWHLMPARLVLPDGRPYYWSRFQGGLAIGQAIDGRLFAGGGGGWRYPDGDPNDGREEWEPATIGVANVHVNTIEIDPLDPSVLYQGISDFGPYKSVDRGASFHRILGNGWPVTVRNFVWNGPYYRNYRKCSLACSSTCSEVGRRASGGTTDFAISRQDPNIVYSAFGSGSGNSQSGGVNKSTDGGRTWRPVGLQLSAGFELNPADCLPYGFRHLAIDPTNDDVVFAAMEIPDSGAGKLYRTTDGGKTWSEVYSTANYNYITGICVSAVDPDLVVVADNRDVYRSERGGERGSWQVITPPQVSRIRTIELSPHRSGVYVVGDQSWGIFYTSDGGSNWTNNRLAGFFEQKLSQESEQYLDPEVATAVNPNAEVLARVHAIAFDPVDPDVFYAGGHQRPRASFGVVKITNAGQNWERLPLDGMSHRNVFDLAIDSLGEYLYAGTNDGTLRLKLR
jgi:photosystem II stability/assembly factor-like uncharacterized protein